MLPLHAHRRLVLGALQLAIAKLRAEEDDEGKEAAMPVYGSQVGGSQPAAGPGRLHLTHDHRAGICCQTLVAMLSDASVVHHRGSIRVCR
jgi:hypothetical protein